MSSRIALLAISRSGAGVRRLKSHNQAAAVFVLQRQLLRSFASESTTTSPPTASLSTTKPKEVELKEPESKAERAVKKMKEKTAAAAAVNSTTEEVSDLIVKPPSPVINAPKPGETAVQPVTPPKKTIWERVKAEALHYYHGFKLLYTDVQVSARLLSQILHGESLTRRERRQLVRTVSDLFRLVPFSVFIIVPFMEFTLPIFLKLFPNMLPSTFHDNMKKEEDMKRNLKAKLEYAKFLQQTVEEMALTQDKKAKTENQASIQDFHHYIVQGKSTSREELIKFSKLFENQLTLENLSRPQLVALCKLLQLPTLGTSAIMRFQLRMKLRNLRADDLVIQEEGLSQLTDKELQSACEARGMRAIGITRQQLENQLQMWLDLHLKEEVPSSLMLLSAAMFVAEDQSPETKLAATLKAMPKSAVDDATIAAAESEGLKVDNSARLEAIKREEQRIKEEKEEEAVVQKQKEAEKSQPNVSAPKSETKIPVEQQPQQKTDNDVAGVAGSASAEGTAKTKMAIDMLIAKAPILGDAISLAGKEDLTSDPKLIKELRVTHEELAKIGEAVAALKADDPLLLEKVELQSLKQDIDEHKEDLHELKSTHQSLKESTGSKILGKRIDKILSNLEVVLEKVQTDVGKARGSMPDFAEIDLNKDGKISTEEMLKAIRMLQNAPSEETTKRLVQFLDIDKDGEISVEELLLVAELIEEEDADVSPEQVREILQLLMKESKIEKKAQIASKVHKVIHKSDP